MLLFTGTLGKRKIGIYLLGVLILLFSSLLISQLLFPGGYSARSFYISDQGVSDYNPVGCYFFIVGIGLTGILIIPYFIFIFRMTWSVQRPLSLLALSGGIIGSVGLSIVGFIPRFGDLDHLHNIGADMAWAGFFTSMVMTSTVLGWGMVRRVKGLRPLRFIILELIVLISGIHVFIFTIDTVKQWTALTTVLLWMVGVYFVLPDKILRDNISGNKLRDRPYP